MQYNQRKVFWKLLMKNLEVGGEFTVPFKTDKQATMHLRYATRAYSNLNEEDASINIDISTRFISKVIRVIRY